MCRTFGFPHHRLVTKPTEESSQTGSSAEISVRGLPQAVAAPERGGGCDDCRQAASRNSDGF